MKNKNFKYAIVAILVIFNSLIAYADGWTSSNPSHSTLYADTITSKTDGSSVNIADSQGLFVTGDITTLGKVGIGTTNPVAKLHINGVSSMEGNGLRFGYSPDPIWYAEMYYNAAGAAGMNFKLSSDNSYWSFNNGKVGIGTAGPLSLLHLNNANANLFLQGGESGNPMVSFSRYSVSDPTYRGAAIQYVYVSASGAPHETGHLAFLTTNEVDAALTEKMRITNSGNVGIGTTSPSKRLDVDGDIAIHMAPTDGGLYFGDDDPVNEKWHIGYWEPSIAPPSGALIFTETGVADGILTLKAGGNVGIGTTSPRETLEVNGNLRLKNFVYKHFAFQGESTGGGNRDEVIYSAPNPPYVGIQGFSDYVCHIRGGTSTKFGTIYFVAATSGDGSTKFYDVQGTIDPSINPRWSGGNLIITVPQYFDCGVDIRVNQEWA